MAAAAHGRSVGVGICLGMATMKMLEKIGITKRENDQWDWKPRKQKQTSPEKESTKRRTPTHMKGEKQSGTKLNPLSLTPEKQQRDRIDMEENELIAGFKANENSYLKKRTRSLIEESEKENSFFKKKSRSINEDTGKGSSFFKKKSRSIIDDTLEEDMFTVEIPNEKKNIMKITDEKPEKIKSKEKKPPSPFDENGNPLPGVKKIFYGEQPEIPNPFFEERPESRNSIERQKSPFVKHRKPEIKKRQSILQRTNSRERTVESEYVTMNDMPPPQKKKRTKFYITDPKYDPRLIQELKEELHRLKYPSPQPRPPIPSILRPSPPGGVRWTYRIDPPPPSPFVSASRSDWAPRRAPSPERFQLPISESDSSVITKPGGLGFSYKPPSLNLHLVNKQRSQ